MKFTLLLALAWISTGVSIALAAPIGIYQQGTVVRMRMGDCMIMHRGFMNQFGPPQAAATEEGCPEYTLVTNKVVFLIVGKSSNQLVPLAETIDFRIQEQRIGGSTRN